MEMIVQQSMRETQTTVRAWASEGFFPGGH